MFECVRGWILHTNQFFVQFIAATWCVLLIVKKTIRIIAMNLWFKTQVLSAPKFPYHRVFSSERKIRIFFLFYRDKWMSTLFSDFIMTVQFRPCFWANPSHTFQQLNSQVPPSPFLIIRTVDSNRMLWNFMKNKLISLECLHFVRILEIPSVGREFL